MNNTMSTTYTFHVIRENASDLPDLTLYTDRRMLRLGFRDSNLGMFYLSDELPPKRYPNREVEVRGADVEQSIFNITGHGGARLPPYAKLREILRHQFACQTSEKQQHQHDETNTRRS